MTGVFGGRELRGIIVQQPSLRRFAISRSFLCGGYEGYMQCVDYGLMFNVLWSARYYAFHVGVGDSFDVVVFVRDGVVVRHSDIVEFCL
jgi:hypothetical protein